MFDEFIGWWVGLCAWEKDEDDGGGSGLKSVCLKGRYHVLFYVLFVWGEGKGERERRGEGGGRI